MNGECLREFVLDGIDCFSLPDSVSVTSWQVDGDEQRCSVIVQVEVFDSGIAKMNESF